MPRRTVKIQISTNNPGKFIDLLEGISEKHAELGASSPLLNFPALDMVLFESIKTEAVAKRKQALQLYATAEALMQQSRSLMGLDKGQNITTPSTLYCMTDIIRGILKIHHSIDEESLTEWGFDVVIRMAKMPKRKQKKQNPLLG